METLTSYGLSEAILEDLRRVFRRFPEIQRVLVYGSRGRGDFQPHSDIDLAVVAPDMTRQRFTELWSALEDLPLIFRLDVVHWDRLANHRLKQRIQREGREIYPAESH